MVFQMAKAKESTMNSLILELMKVPGKMANPMDMEKLFLIVVSHTKDHGKTLLGLRMELFSLELLVILLKLHMLRITLSLITFGNVFWNPYHFFTLDKYLPEVYQLVMVQQLISRKIPDFCANLQFYGGIVQLVEGLKFNSEMEMNTKVKQVLGNWKVLKDTTKYLVLNM